MEDFLEVVFGMTCQTIMYTGEEWTAIEKYPSNSNQEAVLKTLSNLAAQISSFFKCFLLDSLNQALGIRLSNLSRK